MGISTGIVELNTSDKSKMMDFLTEVLDFEIDFDRDEIYLTTFRFKINEDENLIDHFFLEKGSGAIIENSIFVFKVDHKDDLSTIERKFNFFQYRKECGKREFSQFFLEKESFEGNEIGLTIRDIDRRVWRVVL